MLIAPAGAGKSHTMAAFARLWTSFTGRRVIGLTTSTNAARVLAHEGLAESYNIAAFLGKTEGTDELRRPVPLHRDDVLALDEASQLSTTDLAMIGEAARQAGARITATGDTRQLGAVDAGGMFRLLARDVPAAELHEVRRFNAQWEREASVRLRDGDMAAVAAYNRHGRIRGADEEAAYERAASMWLADHLRGKTALLLAGSNAEAAELSRRVQTRLIQLGTVEHPQAALSDENQAGVGDLIRARLNTEIDADGRNLTNRDTLTITALRGPDAQVRRQRQDGTWTEPFRVPRSYLARNAELGYGGNVHVAQARTIDTAHLLVTGSLSRQALYVGMTRGREANTAHVVTGKTAPAGKKPYQQAAPESVLASVLQRDAEDLSATGQIRHAQEQSGGTGHLATALAARTSRLEAANARYEEWSARTASTREMAGKAKAELQRRGQEPAAGGAPGPQGMATWWREFQADADAMDRAIEREHQAAVNDAQPRPPDRKPEAWHEEPDAAAPGCETQLAYVLPGILQAQTDPEPEASELETSGSEAADPGPADDGRAARLDELQARADEAARRFDAQRAELNAISEHTARIEREAQAEPEAGWQAEASYEMDMEL